jgi:AcrR family transcriptional regulator
VDVDRRATNTGGYAKGRATRTEILEQAMSLFGEVGYRSASVREIAARAGISHTGLLHHFPTKQALLVAVLEHRDAVDAERLAVADDGLSALRHLVALVEVNTTRRAIVELFTVLSGEATASDHPAHEWFRERYRRSIDHVTLAYRTARADGVLRHDIDPALAAAQLLAMMDGLQVQWLLDNGATDMVGSVRAHISTQLTVPLD